MARKIQNRMDLRKQSEAAESQSDDNDDDLDGLDDMGDEPDVEADLDTDSDDDDGESKPKRKKKPAKRVKAPARAKRTKTKAVVRKRMLWGVFSSSMKEEARFSFAEKELAEQKLDALHQKNKREYFIQRIKEPIADAPPPAAAK